MAPIASNAPLNLDDDQRFALMKFRRSVKDVLKPEHDDYYLLRWLRARQWQPEAAEKMLRDSLEWREKWGVDTTLKEWQAPEPLIKYFPSGCCGFDKDGAPVLIVPFAGLDVWGMLHAVSRCDCIRQIIITLELHLATAAKQAAIHGQVAQKLTVIFDMEGFSMRQYAWRPAGELIIALIQMYESNYPEILKICYIINAPRVFSLAFSVVKKFMHEYTISKIKIYGCDTKKWQAQLLSSIEPDQLPKHYGGTMVDEDGNPRCISKVPLGGKVPKHYQNRRLSQDKERQLTKVTVKKGDKHAVDLICAQPGCFLRWEFGIENHDIKFLIVSKDEDGKEAVVHGPRKVSGAGTDTGVIAANGPATYTVVFDNSYSFLRSKKVFFDVVITMPVSEMDIPTLPGEDDGLKDDERRANDNVAKLSSITL